LIAGRLTVEGLSPTDAALLASPSFAALIDRQLTDIATWQAAEIKRLVEAIRKQAFDPATEAGPKALRTLWQHWRSHPDVRRALPKPNGDGAASLTGTVPDHKGTAPVANSKTLGGLATLAATIGPPSGARAVKPKGPATDTAPVAPGPKSWER
jgi:hypothetical protein